MAFFTSGMLLVQTTANGEVLAEASLRAPFRKCREVFAPKILEERRHARRVDKVARPFLQRYLFVDTEDDHIGFVRTAPGVSHIVKVGDKPAIVLRSDIDRIKAREYEQAVKGSDGVWRVERFVRLDERPRATFEPGDKVAVEALDGNDEFEAIFGEMQGTRRAVVFMKMLGGGRLVIPVSRLRAKSSEEQRV